MSGWILAAAGPGRSPDSAAWDRALRASGGLPTEVWRSETAGAWLATWRRPKGEFAQSGRLHPRGDGRSCAVWTGIALDESGDASVPAIGLLSEDLLLPERLASLNACFAAAAVGEEGRWVRVATDRHRQYPVYWARVGRGLVAATELDGVLPFLERPAIDREVLDLLVRCGELVDDTTLVRGVEVLGSGTVLEIRGESPAVRTKYWTLRHRGDRGITAAQAAPEIAERLTAAVRRIEKAGPSLVVPLSGGLDSRLILGLCRAPDRAPSMTWGSAGCRDLLYAAEFAARVGSPHREFLFDPGAFPPHWERGVAATAGGFGVRDMYILPFVGALASAGDVALNGLAGDVLLGGNFLRRSWLRAERLEDLAGEAWRWRVSADEEDLTGGLVGDRDGGPSGARDRWTASILRAGEGRPIEVLVDWLYENRIFRFTNGGTLLLRTELESYAPFFDRDLVDYLVRSPVDLRLKHRLYLNVLNRSCPAAGAVPWQRTALPPRWGYPAQLASLVFHRAMRTLGRAVGWDPFPRQGVGSPAGWFRGEWSGIVEDLLLGERALQRKLFAAESVRRLWDTHRSGQDRSRALGVLAAVELFCRRFLDTLR